MDPAEWEQQAESMAAHLTLEVEQLEGEMQTGRPPGGRFWSRIKDVNVRIRTAPAIKLDDKLALQRRIDALCKQARAAQHEWRQDVVRHRQDISERLDFLHDELQEVTLVEQVQALRADLQALRERMQSPAVAVPRADQEHLWLRWQETNEFAWTRLNEVWAHNERELEALLDAARQHIDRSNSREAKNAIQEFHAALRERPCSHRAARELRTRAAALWQEAIELGQRKHQAYVAHTAQRVEQLQVVLQRNQRQQAGIAREIERLEHQAAAASTGVGAALLRGQIAERQRALSRAQSDEQDLRRRIEGAHVVLGQR